MRPALALLTATGALVLGLPATPASAGTTTTAASPCAAFDNTTRVDPILGHGLTMTTPFAGNLVPAGQQPRVDLNVTLPVTGKLSYTLTRRHGVTYRNTITVPATTTALTLPKVTPGAYQVEAFLDVAGKRVGGTCLRFGVNMPGATLDLQNLPDGRDWGGPGPEREIVLQKALGGSLVRRVVSFEQVRRNPAHYNEVFRTAAARASQEGIRFDVMVGQGGAAERAAINTSEWKDTVRALVSENKGVVPFWEAWNEPNYDYFFTGGDPVAYVNKVLKPFYRAVKAADPAAKVVGGSTYGVDMPWWNAFAKAGGFAYLDVVAFHGYEWDTAWENSAMVAEIRKLRALKDKQPQGASKPLWDTESGYRSIREAGGPWAQADYATHKMLWERAMGIPSQHFLVEGGWEDWCVIDQYRGVKPAAMALATMRTVLDGRRFQGWVSTRTKGVFAASFGPSPADRSSVLAVWTAGPTKTINLTAGRKGFDATGSPITVGRKVTVSGSVRYLTVPAGQKP